ncbi:MAG TPA: tetratricopeptide repeat protein [Steroidobacteraceae bacterium]|jgi:TolA-binding protein|nr:tetratricopeptide repeat protein [Steroidobacteraceae bacterium]
MKVCVSRLLSAVASAAVLVLAAPFALEPAHAADQQHVSAKAVKPLKAAQEAMQKEDWDTALAKTLEAKSTAGITPYDEYQINEFLSFIYLKKNDYANAAPAYDAILASGFLPADQMEERLRVAATLNFQLKNYPKAVEYSKRWLETSGGSKPEPYMLLGQSYYVQNDYANAVKQFEAGIDLTRKAGKQVPEQYLQLALSSYAEMDDNAGIKKTLEELLRTYPTPKYWDQMFTMLQNRRDSDDRTTMNLYRLMFDVGQLKRPDDYVELAQYTYDAGVPGESVKVLHKAFDQKLITGKDEQRTRQFMADAEKSAQNDQKSLPTLEKEAVAAKTGDADAALGIAYLSYDQYDKAVEALQRGIQKGGLKRPEEAQLMLGRALLKLNRKDDAVKAFGAIPKDSKLAEVANLWAIYAQNGAGTPAA